MNKSKKRILIASLVLDVIILIPILFYFLVIPRDEVKMLVDGYVEVSIVENQADYKIVSKRPKNWKALKDINYTAAHAIVVSEDWDFYNHSGYDLGQVKEAVEDSVSDGKKLRGASTISQQLVKNLFLSNERSFIRKVKELSFTLYMERTLSKEKILEVYLNIIEYGEGIYGIDKASRHYFSKNPKNLTAREGAFLAMLLPNPKKHAQSFKDKSLTPYAKKIVDSVLEKLVRAKYLKKEQLERELSKSFNWELPGSGTGSETGEASEDGIELKQIKLEDKVRAKMNKKARTAKRIRNEEESYKRDTSIEVSDDPTFDDDAIIEDNSGLEEEFSLE